jgi:hypothetical protein
VRVEAPSPARPSTDISIADRAEETPWYSPMSVREIIAAWTSLAILALVVFLPHIQHGGFYLDDWSDAALTLHPAGDSGLAPALSHFNELLSSARPVLIAFIPLKYLVFDTHIRALLILSIALAVLAAALMYAVLRCLRMPWYHAWLISALTVVYPWFDSTRFWESANPITLAVVFLFAGLWIALIGLMQSSWRLHAVAALLYLLSMLTYEITLPFIALLGLLYLIRNGWRAARFRWLADLAMVAIAGIWDKAHTPKTVSSLSGDIAHFEQITTQGKELVAKTAFPLGNHPHTSTVVGALAVVFALGIGIYLLSPAKQNSDTDWSLRNWLLLGAFGLSMAVLGWAIFIPADPYYTPSIFGVTNRVNGLAGFGLVLLIYSLIGLGVTAVGDLLKAKRWMVAVATVVLGLSLGAAYIHVLERHGRLWDDSYNYQLDVVKRIHRAFPNPPSNTTIFAGGYPANVTLGVPIFAVTWDLDGMVGLTYADPTLRAYPITEELGVECLRNGMRPTGEEGIPIARYGTARLINLTTERTASPHTKAECGMELPRFAPGPLYLATAY